MRNLSYYIEKPWDNASLVRILQNGLEKREMEENDVRQRRELENSNRTIERLYSRLQQDFSTEREQAKDILVTLANLIEAKDSYTDEHTFRVSEGCRLIGRRLNLTPEQVESLAIAGALHDIGKVGTPEHILNKPGKLTPEEFDLIRQHPIKGEAILKPLASLRDILDPVRHHHEKLNGSGYPDGLRGDAVSLEARILAVMDIFDALHTSRPYRAQLPLEKTRAILSEEAERGELDSRVVEALFATIDSGEADSLLARMN